jgi:hypothetical protein
MSKDLGQPAGEDSVLSLRSFTKPVTGLANKMSEWLGNNPAVVLLLAVIAGLVFLAFEGHKLVKADFLEIEAANAKSNEATAEKFIAANAAVTQQFIRANEAQAEKFTATVLQIRSESARDLRAVSENVKTAIDALVKDRERDREIMREMREWMRKADKSGSTTNPTTLARPAGG